MRSPDWSLDSDFFPPPPGPEGLDRPWLKAYGPSTSAEIGPRAFQHLGDMIRSTSLAYGPRKAFSLVLPNGAEGWLTFDDVNAYSDQLALYFRKVIGLKPGDRVALMMPNCLAFPVAAFAVFKAGLILVNTNPLYTVNEMVHQYQDAEPAALVMIDLFGEKIAPVVQATGIRHVVLCRLTDFLPPLRAMVIQTVLKYVRKSVPRIGDTGGVEVVPLRDALHAGASLCEGEAEDGVHHPDLAEYVRDLGPGATALLQYTGGTTGVSKGAELTHGNLISNFMETIELCGRSMVPGKETMLTALPLYHIFAFTVNLLTFYRVGAHNILIPSPRPIANLKSALENKPITWMTGVNTLFSALVEAPWFREAPPPHLKWSIAGGAALHSSVAERFERITRSRIAEGYGMTEASPVVAVNPLGGRILRDSIGVPLPSTYIRIVDDEGRPLAKGESGELWVYGPQVMKGYWRRPDETALVLKDGWLRTGDMAMFLDDGYLRIVDRKKEVIVVSGFKVFPNEVEECLCRHPLVLEAAVIGVGDAHSGEVPRAYVVPRGKELTPGMLKAHCENELARYKVPKEFIFRKELPKTPVGKILRRVLREEQSREG